MLTNMVKLDVNGCYRNLDDSKVYREITIYYDDYWMFG